MDTKWRDYYKDLDLEFGCSEDEIKKSYRDLMKKYHPDSKYANEAKAKEVNEAYGVLGDAEKRAKYDATYLQYKNGEFDRQEYQETEESSEMPKYSYEEMHEAFNEEEIRFAERVALQKVISETLDNAKIIIDAKNELLFAAFNDAYDNETYKAEYYQFYEISEDYIENLRDLISQAESYGLQSEINTIEQVIDYLKEVIASIPKSLDDAKRKAKIEIMREQLQNEAGEILQNAESIRSEFIGLYEKVYRENIKEEEFKMYYDILKIGMIDAISQLEKIYNILKEAKLDELFETVGYEIGKLQKDLNAYSGDYDVAYKLGKREHLRKKVEEITMPFEEYKSKMLEIMKNILQHPDSDNLTLSITRSRAISSEFIDLLPKITKKECEDSDFSKTANEHYEKAKDIFTKREALHKVLSDIFEKTEKVKVGDREMALLKEAVDTTNEELEVIKLLHDAYILFGEHEEYQNLLGSELRRLREDILHYSERCQSLQNILAQMTERICKVSLAYDELNIGSLMNQVSIHHGPEYVEKKLKKYKKISKNIKSISTLVLIGIIAYSGLEGCPVAFIDQLLIKNGSEFTSGSHFFHTIMTVLCTCVPLNMVSLSFKQKCDEFRKNLEIYKYLAEIQEAYDDLMNGNDPQLQKLYRFAEGV